MREFKDATSDAGNALTGEAPLDQPTARELELREQLARETARREQLERERAASTGANTGSGTSSL